MLGLLSIVIGIAAVVYYRITPSVLDPVLWNDPSPLLKLEGTLEPNTVLQQAIKIAPHLHGPESTAFDNENGMAFVSFGDGTVRSFTKDGELVETVFFTGGLVDGTSILSNGLGTASKQLLEWCSTESNEGRLAWDYEGERKCGRPLGLRFRQDGDKYLYIIDAYHGIFKLDLRTNIAEHIVTSATKLKYERGIDPKALLTSTFFNDLDIASDGKIVFTDTSYRHARSQNRPEILDGAPRGRLFEFDPATGELRVLLCGLHFPNGVQYLSAGIEPTPYDQQILGSRSEATTTTTATAVDVEVAAATAVGMEGEPKGAQAGGTAPTRQVQDEVIVNELTRFRVLRINTTLVKEHAAQLSASCDEHGGVYQALAQPDGGVSRGVSRFIANIPGLADNVRVDAKPSATGRNYYLFGLGSKAAHPFSLLHLVFQSNALREVIGRVLPMRLVEKLVPRYGLIVVSDEAGNIVSSLHDPSGGVSMLSQAERNPVTGDLWLGSHSEPLAILPAPFVPASWE